MRLAREAQCKGDLVDAAVVVRRIAQFGAGAGEPLLLDVARDTAHRLEQPIKLAARDAELRAQRLGLERRRIEMGRDLALDALEIRSCFLRSFLVYQTPL